MCSNIHDFNIWDVFHHKAQVYVFCLFVSFSQATCLFSLNHRVKRKKKKNRRENSPPFCERKVKSLIFLVMFHREVAPLTDIGTPGLPAGGQKPLLIHDWQIIHNEKREAIQVLNFTLSLAFQGSWALLFSLGNLWGVARKGDPSDNFSIPPTTPQSSSKYVWPALSKRIQLLIIPPFFLGMKILGVWKCTAWV